MNKSTMKDAGEQENQDRCCEQELQESCWSTRLLGQQLVDNVNRTAAGERNSTGTADGEQNY